MYRSAVARAISARSLLAHTVMHSVFADKTCGHCRRSYQLDMARYRPTVRSRVPAQR